MQSKELSLPEKVSCLVCKKELDHLHGPHLKTHGIKNQAEYKAEFNIPSAEPLHSQALTDTRKEIMNDPKLKKNASYLGKKLGILREMTVNVLASQDLYTPGSAARLVGIPKTTLQSAAYEGRLPYSEVCLLLYDNFGKPNARILSTGDKIVKLFSIQDLLEFAKYHKPKN